MRLKMEEGFSLCATAYVGPLEGLCRFRLSSGSGGGTGTASGNIQEQGKSFSQKSPLTVVTAADSPPFSYMDTTSRPAGDLVGFEVALILKRWPMSSVEKWCSKIWILERLFRVFYPGKPVSQLPNLKGPLKELKY